VNAFCQRVVKKQKEEEWHSDKWTAAGISRWSFPKVMYVDCCCLLLNVIVFRTLLLLRTQAQPFTLHIWRLQRCSPSLQAEVARAQRVAARGLEWGSFVFANEICHNHNPILVGKMMRLHGIFADSWGRLF
jgi:hypothetical protein